jgi:DNA-binding response OmpR family regulator
MVFKVEWTSNRKWTIWVGTERQPFFYKPPRAATESADAWRFSYITDNRTMKLTKQLNELINSGITLTDKETAIVEAFIENHSHPVKKTHLAHYQCLAAIRGK